MLRKLLILTLFLSLSACSKDESATDKHNDKDGHVEHAQHKDAEHHGSEKKESHSDHDDHKDAEHHSSEKQGSHDDHAEHKDAEHHGSEKQDSHDDHAEHKDAEHHGNEKQGSHDDHAEHKDTEHHSSEQKVAHNDHDEHKDDEHHNEKAEGGDEHDGHGGHEEAPGSVHLKAEQMQAANIVVEALKLSDVKTTIRAPGEIKLNAYNTIKVSPRINAQVIARHAVLGDEVIKGQDLVTLSSVEMAEAQGQLLLADKEWSRVKKLGRKVVSARRYITAKVEYEKSYANAKAFGMNENEIKNLLSQKHSADGSFKLVALQAGRVIHDKFIVGERIEAGYELMVITDESTMWVEARVTPQVTNSVDIGNSAEILLSDKKFPAKVVQLHHSLDETTRTSAVRLEVSNDDDLLHAGMFVTAFIETRNTSKAMQVPEESVLRSSDGDWQIMVEQGEAGEFKAVEVELKKVSNGMAIIGSKGSYKIGPGTRVVTHGAFFVQSELAKGGFEIHNH